MSKLTENVWQQHVDQVRLALERFSKQSLLGTYETLEYNLSS